MTMVSLVGHALDGHYQGLCVCGFLWRGQGERYLSGRYSPMLAVAEAVVHVKLDHPKEDPVLTFAPHFEQWVCAWFAEQQAPVPPDERTPLRRAT